MSATYELRPDRTLVITARGELASEDIANLRSEWRGDPRMDAVRDTLVDCRAITAWRVSPAILRHYANDRGEVAHLRKADSRVAIVAPSDVGFGLARMYAQSGDIYGRIEVFRTLPEAEDWLARERQSL